jgi:hypothetical protein
MGIIVGKRLVNLQELDTVCSLEDALNLLEIITVKNYDQCWAQQSRKN